jgi:hypothetical protein
LPTCGWKAGGRDGRQGWGEVAAGEQVAVLRPHLVAEKMEEAIGRTHKGTGPDMPFDPREE